MHQIPVILDTDIGDDIDDAFALALLHSLSTLQLVGVTTVYRNTQARAQMVLKYFAAVGETRIPVRAGESHPYREPLKTLPNEKDTTGKPCSWDPLCEAFPVASESAVDFIIRQAYAYPGALILVGIGALTNIARALEKDPAIRKLLKKIVVMGGWFANHAPEWNVICDPEAYDVVITSGVPFEAVGLDVTLKCTLEKDFLDVLFTRHDPQSQLLAFWFRKWQESTRFAKSVMHDPLAVATLVEDVCTFTPLRVRANLTDLRGALDVLPAAAEDGTVIRAASEVDKNAFFKLFEKQLFPKETLPH